MSALCIHPTCVVSVVLTTLRIEPKVKGSTVRDNFLLNINGHLLLVNQQSCDDQVLFLYYNSCICLLSCNFPKQNVFFNVVIVFKRLNKIIHL